MSGVGTRAQAGAAPLADRTRIDPKTVTDETRFSR